MASAEWEEAWEAAWEAACMISLEAVLEDLVEEWAEDSLPCKPSPPAWAMLLVLHRLNRRPLLRTENVSLELKRRQLIKLVVRTQSSQRRLMRETAADRSRPTSSQIMRAPSRNPLTSKLDTSERVLPDQATMKGGDIMIRVPFLRVLEYL